MEKRAEFDDIRPYYDEELEDVIHKLLKDPEFKRVVKYIDPSIEWDEFRTNMSGLKNKKDFQFTIVRQTVNKLLRKSAEVVDCDGQENLDKNLAYTFISNHRDIVLDPSILCVLLVESGYDTPEIAIGDNLLLHPWITDIVKLNKSFIVKRGVGTRQQYEVSKQLSQYIHYTIREKKQSVWIAQREGRAKNSDDRTQTSVLKMLHMGGEGDFLTNMRSLNIVPLSLSYEYDPCDYLKAKEFQLKKDNPDFKKTPLDDLLNMETGILGSKGNIHFQFGQPINSKLDTLENIKDKNELITEVAILIDKEIYRNYRFYPINYIAYDKLWGGTTFKDKYTPEEQHKVESYFTERIRLIDLPQKDTSFLMQKLLEMYGYPVKNYLQNEFK